MESIFSNQSAKWDASPKIISMTNIRAVDIFIFSFWKGGHLVERLFCNEAQMRMPAKLASPNKPKIPSMTNIRAVDISIGGFWRGCTKNCAKKLTYANKKRNNLFFTSHLLKFCLQRDYKYQTLHACPVPIVHHLCSIFCYPMPAAFGIYIIP